MSGEDKIKASYTHVDPSFFESPVKRIGVSGGTAPFFTLKLTEEGECNIRPEDESDPVSSSRYIGKDVSRAVDEVEFYEHILKLQHCEKNSDDVDHGLNQLFEFAFEYVGVVTLPESTDGEDENKLVARQLMVLQNLYDSVSKLRLLDLKMGEKTASANWRGKSRFRAYKQGFLDSTTNSTKEGFRLEGYDGMNKVLDSMDPLNDIRMSSSKDDNSDSSVSKLEKKAVRRNLQTLTGADIFRHFLDLHLMEANDGEEDAFMNSEVSEIALHEITCRLIKFCKACHQVKTPQKWIGSSVALGYDAGFLPSRSVEAEEAIRSKVICNIFDWGRSEFLTKAMYDELSAPEQKDREEFWGYYLNAADRIAYSAAKIYYHQFTNSDGWENVTIEVVDFDSIGDDDFMGKVAITLPDIPDEPNAPIFETYKLTDDRLFRSSKCGTLKVGISWNQAPESSRLRGIWCISIDQGSDLKIADTTSSDPYCIVTAKSKSGNHKFRKMTSVKKQTRNPVWNETLLIPVASNSSELRNSMVAEGLSVESQPFPDLFGKKNKDDPTPKMLATWTELLSKA